MKVCRAVTKTPEVQDKVGITWDLDEATPPIMINPKSMYDAVMNLVSNAVDACIDHGYESQDNPWVKVTTRLERGNRAVRIEVTDNAGGISDELKEKIFRPFFPTKYNKGAGLGLAITMKVAREHKGTLSLGALPGNGATFTIALPLAGAKEIKAGGSE